MYQGFAQQYYSQRRGGISFQRCSQDTQVPVSKPFSYADMMNIQNSLQVPNGEEVPMGCENLMENGLRGNTFTCMDGTVLDVKSGKVLSNPCECGRNSSTWGSRMMENPFKSMEHGTWDDREINSFNPYVTRENPEGLHLDGEDLEYKRYSDMKNRELENNMGELQKRLMNDLENGRFIKRSRLIEESKKI